MMQENTLLKTCLSNLWKSYQYQQEYTAFLLGSYTETEFMDIAKDYAAPFDDTLSLDKLLHGYRLVTDVLQASLTSYDLSVLFNVDCSWIEQQLFSSPANKVLQPTPKGAEQNSLFT